MKLAGITMIILGIFGLLVAGFFFYIGYTEGETTEKVTCFDIHGNKILDVICEDSSNKFSDAGLTLVLLSILLIFVGSIIVGTFE